MFNLHKNLPLAISCFQNLKNKHIFKKTTLLVGVSLLYDGFLGSIIPLSYQYPMSFYFPVKIKEQTQRTKV